MTVGGLGIIPVAFVKTQNRLRGNVVIFENAVNQRFYNIFQFLNRTAVNPQFRRGSVLINCIPVTFQKQAHAFFNNAGAVGAVLYLDFRAFQEIAHAADQGIVIYNVGDFSRRDRQSIRNGDFFRLFQIGRTGKADHGIDRSLLRPTVDHGPEFDFTADRVVYLVNKDGQRGQGPDQVA